MAQNSFRFLIASLTLLWMEVSLQSGNNKKKFKIEETDKLKISLLNQIWNMQFWIAYNI